MPGRTGGSLSAAKEDLALAARLDNVRYCTVRCGLDPKRNHKQVRRLRYPALKPVFQSVACRTGFYRHVVSLVANRLVIDDPNIVVDAELEQNRKAKNEATEGGATHGDGDAWKTFYDQTWSAVEAVTAGSSKSNRLHDRVAIVLQSTTLDVPEKVPFDLRQQETRQMKTQTLEHIQLFQNRLQHVMMVKIAEANPSLKWKVIDSMTKHALKCTLSQPTELQKKKDALAEASPGKHVSERVLELVDEERMQLGELVSTANANDFSSKKGLPEKRLRLLLPHLMRLSRWSEEWLERHFGASDTVNESRINEDDDGEAGKEVRKWSRKRLAKPFSVLPVCKLQAANLLYTYTELITLLNSVKKRRRDEFGLRWSRVDTPARKCNRRIRCVLESAHLEADNGHCHISLAEEALASIKALVKADLVVETSRGNFQPVVDESTSIDATSVSKDDFAASIFNMESFKGRRGSIVLEDGTSIPKWRIACFRTDGVSLSVTFVSGVMPGPFNAETLLKAGYKLRPPDRPVDLVHESRGLFYVGQERCDVASASGCRWFNVGAEAPCGAIEIPNEDFAAALQHQTEFPQEIWDAFGIDNLSANSCVKSEGEYFRPATSKTMPVRVSVIDPGFVKPVHVATVTSSTDDPIRDSGHWFITEDEWMEKSGRTRSQRAEQRRREGTAYGDALLWLCDRGRKKSVTAKFEEYFVSMISTLRVRASELVCVARSAARWMQKRSIARFLGRLCDRIFDRTSTRPQKVAPPPDQSDEQRRDWCQRLREIRDARRQQKSVVFFGDASYGPTMQGHNAIPKKPILRELCHRGVTFLLDEYRTSKMCPCGQDELKTTAGRLRAHKSDGSVCDLLNRACASGCDRDAIATINMMGCALCALAGNNRPGHLCRPRCHECDEE